MQRKLQDWRGSSSRFLEGTTDPLTDLTNELRTKLCLIRSQDGSTECRFLGSVRLRWRTVMPEAVGKVGAGVGQTGVNQGLACGVTLIATCRECKRRLVRSATLLTDALSQLSLKNLALNPPGGTFISWRLEISNCYRDGSSV